MAIHREDWGPRTPPGGRETAGQASVPPATGPKYAEPAHQDLAPIADAEDYDEEEAAADRKLLADGIFTREELARHRGRPAEEIAPPKSKVPSRQAVDKELAEIAEYRRGDRRGYFKDEAKQARERELIELREQLKAGPTPAAPAEPGDQVRGRREPRPAPHEGAVERRWSRDRGTNPGAVCAPTSLGACGSKYAANSQRLSLPTC